MLLFWLIAWLGLFMNNLLSCLAGVSFLPVYLCALGVPDSSIEDSSAGVVVMEDFSVDGVLFDIVFGVGLADEFEIDAEHVWGTVDIGGESIESIVL